MNNYIAHVLVVDDDEGIRSLVKKFLNEKNYLVTTASNAENAHEKVKIIKFDLIILDIMMPGKSGLDFLNEYKKDINTPKEETMMNSINWTIIKAIMPLITVEIIRNNNKGCIPKTIIFLKISSN